jgi:hypothetical protein
VLSRLWPIAWCLSTPLCLLLFMCDSLTIIPSGTTTATPVSTTVASCGRTRYVHRPIPYVSSDDSFACRTRLVGSAFLILCVTSLFSSVRNHSPEDLHNWALAYSPPSKDFSTIASTVCASFAIAISVLTSERSQSLIGRMALENASSSQWASLIAGSNDDAQWIILALLKVADYYGNV